VGFVTCVGRPRRGRCPATSTEPAPTPHRDFFSACWSVARVTVGARSFPDGGLIAAHAV
jgi:hypothetical protein